ncbi:hypothetical protein [Ekhidna sp.]|uniref:hypothetical protein n=1 Tax=Ekhidna sp. TaxID=2608089 RepID=UPI003C79AA52
MKYLVGALLALIVFNASAQEEGGLKRPDIPGHLMLDIGLNYWDQTAGNLNQKGWPSKSLGLYYTKFKKLGNSFTINYGLGMTWEKIGFEVNVDDNPSTSDAVTIQTDSLGNVFFGPLFGTTSRISFKKYKVGILYVDAPFEFRWYPRSTQDGEGLFISFGGILGLKVKSFDKTIFELNGEKFKTKSIGDFGLNSFRYGVQARLGFNGIHVFYKQYFSDVFSDPILVVDSIDSDGTLNGSPISPTMTTIGINITGF